MAKDVGGMKLSNEMKEWYWAQALPVKRCKHPNCKRFMDVKGYCMKHYMASRWQEKRDKRIADMEDTLKKLGENANN